MTSELSGNLIDVCPVGALTSRPSAFHFRSWELKNTNAIDVVDAVGSNIVLQVRGNEIMRILPRDNDDINECWLSDKARFSLDGLKRRRLDYPWIRKNGKLEKACWADVISLATEKIKSVAADKIGAIAGDLCDAESMYVLKKLMKKVGSSNFDCRQDGAYYDVSHRGHYVFNSSIYGIEQADALLIIGSFPRQEAPVLNARIRKRWLSLVEGFPVAYIGELPDDLTYKCDHIGENPEILDKLLQGSHPFVETLKTAKRPMIILGHGALVRKDAKAIFEKVLTLAYQVNAVSEEWNGFNILHHAASRVAGLDLGFIPQDLTKNITSMLQGGVELLWLLGADEIDVSLIKPETFVIYQGHHGDKVAAMADIILPGVAYTEKSGTYVNTEGRVQTSSRAVLPVGEAKEDWEIIMKISQALGMDVFYQDIYDLRSQMEQEYPVFAQTGIGNNSMTDSFSFSDGKLDKQSLVPIISDYFLTNSISRASVTMHECSKIRNDMLEVKAAE